MTLLNSSAYVWRWKGMSESTVEALCVDTNLTKITGKNRDHKQ